MSPFTNFAPANHIISPSENSTLPASSTKKILIVQKRKTSQGCRMLGIATRPLVDNNVVASVVIRLPLPRNVLQVGIFRARLPTVHSSYSAISSSLSKHKLARKGTEKQVTTRNTT
ncbi:hypothetical protein PCANC_01825 [Puccinia coronata f. sp. avenae]|uniref:Uncharacterized protein n=1 Tax=Puccinia coronata f. sp. avenae TaxID=200324 RepID=A0A2N5W557_9BASI|nr:hypothetical protein PCANC_01825 [Puccinia coronata f. sp. avenae]